MAMPNTLTVVSGGDDLFRYPLPSDFHLKEHFYMQWPHREWMTCDFRLRADREVRSVGFDLMCVAYDAKPAGTLPTDEILLHQLVGVSLEQWRALCARSIGPLEGWKKCMTDTGEVRLYNPMLLAVVVEASKTRRAYLEKKDGERERKRLDALPKQIVQAGASQRLADDEAYILRLDQFLLEHYPPPTQRRPRIVRAAMEELDALERNGVFPS